MTIRMKPRPWLGFAILLLTLTLAACGSGAKEDSETRVQTRVAEEQAVAATLTASVATPAPVAQVTQETEAPTQEPESQAPTDTPAVVDFTAIAVDSPADTPIPPTNTPVVVDFQPAATPTLEPPTPTPVVVGFVPVDGDDGNDFLRSSFDDNQGRVILLPGYSPEEIAIPMVFRDRMVFQVEVFDTRAGLYDGAGIRDVTFTIEDEGGDVVYQHTEKRAGYCVFGGGEPDCNVLWFDQAGYRWPDGGEIVNGDYLAKIDIQPEQDDGTQWRWRFVIDIPGRGQVGKPPALPPNTARITAISEENGRYVVDFVTGDFTPTLPGQHLHFFWNTVPPEQAGAPGKGPWQLYPPRNGASGASPFTLFGVNDRPAGASQICVLVANPNHSVNLGTGNCVDLP